MENTIKLYRCYQYEAIRIDQTGEYFSLTPYGNNTLYFKGYDDGGKEYILPEGYSIGETYYGDTAIFDKDNYYVHLCVKDDSPALIIPTMYGNRYIKLNPVLEIAIV